MPEQVILIANKFHADSGFQIDPEYSKQSIKLRGTGIVGTVVFVPKSICEIIPLKSEGAFEVRIERWFCEQSRNKPFFISKL